MKFKKSLILSILGTAAVAFSSIAFAAEINPIAMKAKFFVDGKVVARPGITARPNQAASIEIRGKTYDLKIRMLANDVVDASHQNAIRLNLDVNYVSGHDKVHSQPTFVVIPNQQARMKLLSTNGHTYEIAVVAHQS